MRSGQKPFTPVNASALVRFAWLSIPIFLALIGFFWLANIKIVLEPPYLLPLLNFIFSTAVSIFVAYLAVISFARNASVTVLMLGSGMLFFGMVSLIGAIAIQLDRINVGITVYNTGVLFSGICHFLAAAALVIESRVNRDAILTLSATYALVLTVTGLLTYATVKGLTPVFFVQDTGPTPLRQAVLGAAVCVHVVSGIIIALVSRRFHWLFGRWYALSLLMIAIGLFGVLIISHVGSPLGWSGRAAQYLGGIYMLVAVIAAAREDGEWDAALQLALKDSQERYRILAEATFEGIVISEDGVIVDTNEQFCRMLGYSEGELIGKRIADLIPDEDRERISGTILSDQDMTDEHMMLKRNGALINVESHGRMALRNGKKIFFSAVRDITDRKKSEKALQESEEKFSKAFHNSPTFLFITEFETGVFVDVNEAYAILTGYAREELIGHSSIALGILTSESRAEILRHLTETGRVQNMQTQIIRKDGEARTCLYSVEKLEYQKKPCLICSGIDITEREKMEDAVHKSEQLLRDVLNNMVAMIGLMTPDGTLIEANRTSLEAANLKPEEVLGKPFEECYWWAWSPVVQERLRNAIARAAAGQVSRYDEVIRVGEGKYRTIDFMLSPMFGTDGRITYLIPSATDITDRKKAEEALHLAVERHEWQVRLFEGVAGTTPDFVYLFNLQGRFQYANRRLLEVWGMNLEQVVGKTCRELGYEQWHHDMHMREIAQVIETKRPIKGEVPFKAPLTGIFGVYEYIFTPVINPDGEVELIAGTTRDISERKRMEDELRHLNESLEQKVAERTELLEARSKQLQTLAVEVIEAEERERRKIAHLLHNDLQQMLAAAKMQLQAVSDNLPGQVMLKNIGEIVEESLAKTRRLSHELSPAVLHHSGLIEGLKWLSGQMKEQFGLKTVVEGNTDKLLEGTPLKLFLFRAVQELLFNIVKHAGVKTARIECSSVNDTYTVSVSDQGRGFDPMILKTYKEKLGLGLLSIRERVNYFGGNLAIESVPGNGSRFTLTVPISPSHAEDFQHGCFHAGNGWYRSNGYNQRSSARYSDNWFEHA